jgi:hypothetical protein
MWPGCAVRRTSRGLWLHGTGSPPHLIANAARHSAGAGRLRCDYCESSRQSRIDCDSRLSTVHMLLRLLLCAIFGSDDVMGGPDQVLVVRNDERLRLRLRLLFCQTNLTTTAAGSFDPYTSRWEPLSVTMVSVCARICNHPIRSRIPACSPS